MAPRMPGHPLTRRAVLSSGVIAAAGALIAACAPALTPTAAPAAKPAQPAPTAAPAAKAVPAGKQKVSLTVAGAGSGKHKEIRDKQYAAFNQKNPSIEVNHYVAPTTGGSQGGHDLYVTVFSAKDPSMDIVSVDTGSQWPAEFAPAGWLEAIDDILPKPTQEKLMPQMIYQSYHAGKIYAWPWFNDVGVFFVRKDLLQQAGKKIPETWQEMVETAKVVAKPPEMWGFIPNYRKDEQLTCNFQEYFWSNNGDMTDKDGKITINAPEVVEALQFAIDLMKVHKITPQGVISQMLDEGRQIFTQGKALFHRNWAYPWGLAHGPESSVAGKIEMAVLPKFGANGKHVSNLGGWSWSINKFSVHKDEARQLVTYLGDVPQQIEAYVYTGYPPAHMDAYNEENLKKYPAEIRAFAEPYFKVALTAKSRPRHPQYREVSEIMQVEAQAAMLGQKTPNQACDTMAQQLTPLLQGWKP